MLSHICRILIESLLDEIKFVVTEKFEIEFWVISILLALIGTFGLSKFLDKEKWIVLQKETHSKN